MPFLRKTFLGASIVKYGCSIGWGIGSTSQLSVELVEDQTNQDAFLPVRLASPTVGQPVYFEHYGFQFAGLLQKWEERRSREGLPLFDVTVIDPREILDGAQVITSTYSGTHQVPNLYNVYGYWEAKGFGQSSVNESGMPWPRVSDALNYLANNIPTSNDYGGPLQFCGYRYTLDLSSLPPTPEFYRISGPSISLLEMIAQICDDGGCDFYVTLVGFTIKVVTVSRLSQPPLGTIAAITNTNWGTSVSRSTNGMECRNELTSSFLVGDQLTTLNQTSTIQSFWGYDFNNQPVLGSSTYLWTAKTVVNQNGDPVNAATLATVNNWPAPALQAIQPPTNQVAKNAANIGVGVFKFEKATTDIHDSMLLNASPVADLIGTTTYSCSTLEMRLAKVNYESWAHYMQVIRKPVCDYMGLLSPYANPAGGLAPILGAQGMVNDGVQNASALAQAASARNTHVKCQRLYQFVRGYADEYMGKKYLVGVPFILRAVEAETLKVSASYEVTDGGYLPENESPLGLSLVNQDILQTPDGRYKAFVKWTNLTNADISAVSPQGTVIETSGLFMEVQVDPTIAYVPAPGVVITLQAPLTDIAIDGVGDLRILGALLQNNNTVNLQSGFDNAYMPLKVAPAVRKPAYAAIPLKSNMITYGPWTAIGAAGKVKVEQDSSLNPWNYGSYDAMNQAANAKVDNCVTNMQVCETGEIELAGTPTISMGGTLQGGGPNLTGIDVTIGKEGVTTRYRFSTFTPKFGVFSKSQQERFKRMALQGVEQRRSIRAAIRERVGKLGIAREANRANRAFLELAPAAVRRQSPHDVLTSYSAYDSTNNKVISTLQTATYPEAVTLANADLDAEYQETAVMNLSGLLRPFSTSVDRTKSLNMPHYVTPTVPATAPSVSSLNPWKAKNDVDVYAYGNTYAGLHASRRGGDFNNARPICLRGPMVVAGFGFDTLGNTFPANTGVAKVNGVYTQWASGYLERQDLWGVGPVDLLWNAQAGTWSCHDIVKGTMSTACAAGSSGTLAVQVLNSTGYNMTVWNYFSTAVTSGSKVLASFVAADNRWYLSSADCPAS